MKNVQISKKQHVTGITYQNYIFCGTKQYHNNYNTQRSQQFSLPINCAFTSWQILCLTLLDAIPKKFQRCHFSLFTRLQGSPRELSGASVFVLRCLLSANEPGHSGS